MKSKVFFDVFGAGGTGEVAMHYLGGEEYVII